MLVLVHVNVSPDLAQASFMHRYYVADCMFVYVGFHETV